MAEQQCKQFFQSTEEREHEIVALAAMTTSTSIKVVVGEDEPLMREGIVHVLNESGFDVVGVASEATGLIAIAESLRPDVVITDIQMPPTSSDDGLEAARHIRSRFPEIAVIVLSQYLEAQYALALLSDGAEKVGYLLKDRVANVSDFTDAVRRVVNGGTALDPEVVRRMVDRPRRKSPLDSLTRREGDVLALMAEGLSNKGIAERLVVSVAAVERHATSLFAKLQLSPTPEDHRRVLAVLLYLQNQDRPQASEGSRSSN
jgi:DNA-binding NarL/FixJ family response regulator